MEGDFGKRETSKKADTEAGDHLSVGVAVVCRLSLVAVSGVYSLDVECMFPIEVASLVAEHRI